MVLPLNDSIKIKERLDTVEYFLNEADIRNKISHHVKQAGDVERLVSKVPLKKVNPREVLQIARGLLQTASIKEICAATHNEYLQRLGDSLNPCKLIVEKIVTEINEAPPALASKGGVIANGIWASRSMSERQRPMHWAAENLMTLIWPPGSRKSRERTTWSRRPTAVLYGQRR